MDRDFILHYNALAQFVIGDEAPHDHLPGRCRVRVRITGSTEQQTTVVILTELPDNGGSSVTNTAEAIATALCHHLFTNLGRILWIEHYPASETPEHEETFDLVTFEWATREEQSSRTWEAHRPDWQRITRATVEDLLHEVRED